MLLPSSASTQFNLTQLNFNFNWSWGICSSVVLYCTNCTVLRWRCTIPYWFALYYAEDVLYRTDLHCIMLKMYFIVLICTVLCWRVYCIVLICMVLCWRCTVSYWFAKYYAEDVLYRTDLHCIMLKGVLYRTGLHMIMLMCTVLCLELKSLLSIPRGRRSLYILSLLFAKSPWLLIS